jgi:hypothetical protein
VIEMPFGKNKALAMPMPKKTKVAAPEDALESTDDTAITGTEEPPPGLTRPCSC